MSITDRDLLVSFLCSMKMDHEPPTREELYTKAKLFGPAMGVHDEFDIQKASTEAESLRLVTILPAHVLKSKKPHDNTWVKRIEQDNWSYWNSYERLLRQQKRSEKVIDETAKSTLQTLSWLQDPTIDGPWTRKGLVIGHVQSGKTANFVGLISRSADAGYKFIVVLGGTLNSLRKQTQERLDSDFIGVTHINGVASRAGVGKVRDPQKIKDPSSLTSASHDFNRMIPNQIKADIASFGTLIVVIKKNVTTLRNLKNWLQMYSQTNGAIHVPMLMIDDEADYASVNTNDVNKKPTAINAAIREILAMFQRKAYVGYTATPFANVFINPDTTPDDTDDLFPEHFIQVLEPPSDYFGTGKVFPIDEGDPDEDYETSPWIKFITDADAVLPLKQGQTTVLETLPESLRDAVKVFALTRAIRRLRGDAERHCSMLVNMSHLTRIHKQTADLLKEEVGSVKRSVTYCYALEDSLTLENTEWQRIKELFSTEFANIPETWDEVLPHLRAAVDEIDVRAIHQHSTEKLDYVERSLNKDPLVVIAVGGNTLSRGITVEDLTVSYLRRSTNLADSLLQMGRWFGYRPGYEDLCRIWLTPELLEWYHFITGIDFDLRRQVIAMIRDNLEPKDFALRVRKHPDTLLLTAQNKMRNTQTITERLSLAGKLSEMFVLSTDAEINAHNRKLIQELNTKLQPLTKHSEKPLSFRNIPRSIVSEFMGKFHFHADWLANAGLISGYMAETADDHPEWDIIFFNGEGSKQALQLEETAMKQRNRRIQLSKLPPKIPVLPPSGKGYYLNKQRLGGKGDEGADFTKEEDQSLEILKNGPSPVSSEYLQVRGRPLLMISLVELYEKKTKDDSGIFKGDELGIPALGWGFPLPKDGKILKTVEVVVNQAIHQRLLGAMKVTSEGDVETDDDDD